MDILCKSPLLQALLSVSKHKNRALIDYQKQNESQFAIAFEDLRHMLKILVFLKLLTKDLYLTFENSYLYEGVHTVVAKKNPVEW